MRTITYSPKVCTCVCGAKDHSAINGNAALNQVETCDAHGARIVRTLEAFILHEKTSTIADHSLAVLNDIPPSCVLEGFFRLARSHEPSHYSGESVLLTES
jgi:hypothetical protein